MQRIKGNIDVGDGWWRRKNVTKIGILWPKLGDCQLFKVRVSPTSLSLNDLTYRPNFEDLGQILNLFLIWNNLSICIIVSFYKIQSFLENICRKICYAFERHLSPCYDTCYVVIYCWSNCLWYEVQLISLMLVFVLKYSNNSIIE